MLPNPEMLREMKRLDMHIRYRGHALDLRLTRASLTIRDVIRRHYGSCSASTARLANSLAGLPRVLQLNN